MHTEDIQKLLMNKRMNKCKKPYQFSLSAPTRTKGFIHGEMHLYRCAQVCPGVGQAPGLLTISSALPLLNSSENSRKELSKASTGPLAQAGPRPCGCCVRT